MVAFSPCHLASIPLIVVYVGGQETLTKPRQGAGNWFRKGAGAVIGLLGVYFISSPFISAV
jgi:cytochrome c-type biogenesis protein